MAEPALLPAWAYDLIIAAENYEDVHGNAHDGWLCLNDQLQAVPADYRQQARAIAAYLQALSGGQQATEPRVWPQMGVDPWRDGLPNWFHDLLAAMESFETAHADPPRDGEVCLKPTLQSVPAAVRLASVAIAAYLRQKAEAP